MPYFCLFHQLVGFYIGKALALCERKCLWEEKTGRGTRLRTAFPGFPKPWRSWFQARFNCEGSLQIKMRPNGTLLEDGDRLDSSQSVSSRLLIGSGFVLVCNMYRFSWALMSLEDILGKGKSINRQARENSRACSGQTKMQNQQSVASISLFLHAWNRCQKTPKGCQTRYNFY